MKLAEKVVLVTGGSKGIGSGIVIEAAKEGADVIINYNSDLKNAEKTLGIVKKLGRKGYICKADVSKKIEVEKMVDKSIDYFGKIDVLINNAGIALWKPFLEIEEDNWDSTININLKGVFLCSQAVAKYMVKNKIRGSIVNIASAAAYGSLDCLVPYCASKGGVILITKSMAVELAAYGIRVNSLSPGTTDVKRNRDTDINYPDNWKPYIPLGRVGTVEEIAKPVIFLASSEASYITGQNFYADGGITSYVPMPGADFAK
ncbi:MAG TPA: glucose 1-dehydrogenase [Victivallales bacterium]|nr:glucose 1-dehydrogenase [Victivallales bacterium]